MKPVMQEVLSQTHGDCFRATTASVLELGIEDVPNFVGMYRDNQDQWWWKYVDWLGQFGLTVFNIILNDENRDGWREWLVQNKIIASAGVRHNGVNHSVVIQGDQVVHDPWPNQQVEFHFDDVLDVQLIVPKNPASLARAL